MLFYRVPGFGCEIKHASDQERPSGVVPGHDGLLVRLPAGSKDVEQTGVN